MSVVKREIAGGGSCGSLLVAVTMEKKVFSLLLKVRAVTFWLPVMSLSRVFQM